jgi:uncharacterized protein (TIGR03067 family)
MSLSRILPLVMFVPLSSLVATEADDTRRLQGVWTGWVVEGRGDDPRQRRTRVELTIKGNTIRAVEDGSRDLGTGTFTLRSTREGKQMDATRTTGRGSAPGATYLGIFLAGGIWGVASGPSVQYADARCC